MNDIFVFIMNKIS